MGAHAKTTTEQSNKTRASDLPARTVNKAKAEEVKGGAQRRQDIIAI